MRSPERSRAARSSTCRSAAARRTPAVSTALPAQLAQALADAGIPADQPLVFDQNVLLLEIGPRRVLIDTGAGGLLPGTGQLKDQLQAAGVPPESIDTVVLTHLHWDHVGGLVDQDSQRVYPNARVLVARAEWDYWQTAPDFAELAVDDQLRGLLATASTPTLVRLADWPDMLELVDPGAEVAPGVTLLDGVGHTPGHTGLQISSGGSRLVHIADAMNHPQLQVPHTDWFGLVDTWPAHVVPTRRRLLDLASGPDTRLFASHFPFPGLGRVTTREASGWRWQQERAA